MKVRVALALCIGLGVAVVGCGGGGGGSEGVPSTDGSATNGGSGQAASQGTARFRVDVDTGEVHVTSLGAQSRSIFSGGLVTFQSSTLVDEPGNIGRKALNVTMTNRSGEPIGIDDDGTATGIRVFFSDFTNIDATTDLRTLTQMATLSGGVGGFQDGALSGAMFLKPSGMAVASDGTIYVADTDNNRVRKISMGSVSTLAGSGSAGSVNGSGTAATFNRPFGIVVGPDDHIYVTELLGRRVRRITPSGVVTTVAGTGVAGTADGLGSVAKFNGPEGIAADSDGTLYIADSLNHRIRKITPGAGDPRIADSYTVSTVAGAGTAGFADGIGILASFNTPRGVAVGSDGTVYVADRLNHRLRRISPGREVVTIAGTGSTGTVDGDGGSARFAHPSGVTVVGDSLLLYDGGSKRLRQAVLKPGQAPGSANSWTISTLAGTGGSARVDGAGDVAEMGSLGTIDESGGTLYLADATNNALRMLTSNAGLPVPSNGGTTTAERVTLVDPDGVEFANKVEALKVDTPYLRYTSGLGVGESTSARKWQFSIPDGVKAFEFTVVVSADTSFYTGLDAGLGVGSANNYVRTIAGRNLGGYRDGPGNVATFNSANGIAVDDAGVIYVADTNNHVIRRIDTSGFVSTLAGLNSAGSGDGAGNLARFNGPRGVACLSDGSALYVADSNNHTIRRIRFSGGDPRQPTSWVVSTIAGLAGAAAYADGADGTTARFNFPVGIAIQSDRMVIVGEFSGNRIRRLMFSGGDINSAASWRPSLVAGSSVSPVGTAGTTNGFGTSARFDLPNHIAIDKGGHIYVVDSNNQRIRKISPDTDVTTLAGSVHGYVDGDGVAAQIGGPQGIAVDNAGYVYVSDGFHRIRRISPSGAVRTVAGTGTTFPERDGLGTEVNLYFPLGLACRSNGELYVVDGGTYPFEGGGGVTSPGLKVKLVERVKR